MFVFDCVWGQGEDTEESVNLTQPRTKTSTTSPEEASLTQKTPAKKKLTVLFSYHSLLSQTISNIPIVQSMQQFFLKS